MRFRAEKPIQAVGQFVDTLRAGYIFPALPRRASRVEDAVAERGWGWLPALSLVGALGLLLVALADTGARYSTTWAEPLFWMGLLVLFAPIAVRLASSEAARSERIGLVVALGLGLYLVKILHSPLAFTQHDEFYHWRTANDIITHGRLFTENPMLPVSALFPGMENVIDAIVSLSGMSIFSAGVVLMGVARLILTLALYLLYEQISRSSQVAGVASVLYMANPSYLFFTALFKYETLALSFVALLLYAAVRRQHPSAHSRLALTVIALLALGVVATTHHLTSYALTMFLVLWTIVSFKIRSKNDLGPGGMMLLAIVVNLTWLVYVASIVVGYLAPHFQGAVSEVIRLIAREQDAGRQLFGPSATSGERVTPLWERTVGFAAVGLLLLGLPFGLLQIWRRHRDSAIALALGVGVLAYPASLALRLTRRGWEIANRSSEFVFLTIGFVVAIGVVSFMLEGRLQRMRAFVYGLCASVIFIGGIIAGSPPAWRLPGPYLFNSGTRSIEPEGVAAAEWTRSYLGPDNRVGAYGTDNLLLGSYGEQHIVIGLSSGVSVEWLMFKPSLEPDSDPLWQRGQVQYLVINRRLGNFPDLASRYWPGAKTGSAIAKFDHIRNVSRLFDSGNIIIYDLRALDHVP